jgi:hypothetical protein
MSENPNERSIYLQHLKNLSSLFDSGLSDYPSFNVQMLDILDYASTSSSNSISNANNGSINARISNSSALKVGNRQPVHSDGFYGDYQLVGQLNPFLENWEGRASLLDEALLLGLGVLGQ